MEVYNVAKDYNYGCESSELSYDSLIGGYDRVKFEPEQWDWIVVAYYSGSYEGTGDLIAKNKNGLLYHTALGHCSCYGPLDGELGTIDINDESALAYNIDKNVLEKVKELLGA